jgi:hypothetical protein
MSRKPKAVAMAEQLADDRFNELFGTDSAEEAEETPEEATEAAEPEATQPSADDRPEEPAERGTPARESSVNSELEAYKARYNTLMGKYNSEVPRLQGEIRQLRQQLQLLQESTATPKESKRSEESLVSPDEIEDYGADFTDFIRRIVAESMREHERLKPTAARAAEPAGGPAADGNAMSSVFSVLDVEVPQWREINTHPQFASWVDSYDPILGTTRRQALLEAYQQGNGYRVAAFFQSFLRQESVPARETPKKELSQISGPGESGSGPPPRAGSKKIWSRAEIQAFYHKVRRGVYRDNPKQQALIEQQIAEAMREGRIEGV